MSKQFHRIITDDVNMFDGVTSYVDRKMLGTGPADEGLIHIQSVDQLMELARRGKAIYDQFDKLIRPMINRERALFVKDLYQKQKYTQRALAIRCWAVWNGVWQPPSNQLAGMKILQVSGDILKEQLLPPPTALKDFIRSIESEM